MYRPPGGVKGQGSGSLAGVRAPLKLLNLRQMRHFVASPGTLQSMFCFQINYYFCPLCVSATHLHQRLAGLVVGQLQVGVLVLQLVLQLRDASLQSPLFIQQGLPEITQACMSHRPPNPCSLEKQQLLVAACGQACQQGMKTKLVSFKSAGFPQTF